VKTVFRPSYWRYIWIVFLALLALALMGMSWDTPVIAVLVTIGVTAFTFGVIVYQWFDGLNRRPEA
jgi:hypothetical protein